MAKRPSRLRHEGYGCSWGLCRCLFLAAPSLWLLLGLGDDDTTASRQMGEHPVEHLVLSSPSLARSTLLPCEDVVVREKGESRKRRERRCVSAGEEGKEEEQKCVAAVVGKKGTRVELGHRPLYGH